MKPAISLLAAALLAGLTNTAAAAGGLTIDSVVLDPRQGDTLATTCVNSKGYYMEMGNPDYRDESRLHVSMRYVDAPVADVLKTLVPQKWLVRVSEKLPDDLRLTWEGNKLWHEALRDIATQHNLVAIIDWSDRQVYLDRL